MGGGGACGWGGGARGTSKDGNLLITTAIYHLGQVAFDPTTV